MTVFTRWLENWVYGTVSANVLKCLWGTMLTVALSWQRVFSPSGTKSSDARKSTKRFLHNMVLCVCVHVCSPHWTSLSLRSLSFMPLWLERCPQDGVTCMCKCVHRQWVFTCLCACKCLDKVMRLVAELYPALSTILEPYERWKGEYTEQRAITSSLKRVDVGVSCGVRRSLKESTGKRSFEGAPLYLPAHFPTWNKNILQDVNIQMRRSLQKRERYTGRQSCCNV